MWAAWCIYADGALATAAFLTWWFWKYPPPDANPMRWWERLSLAICVGGMWPLFWIDAPHLLGVRRKS